MNFSESRQNRSRENREKSKNQFFPPTPIAYITECEPLPHHGDLDIAPCGEDIGLVVSIQQELLYGAEQHRKSLHRLHLRKPGRHDGQ